MTRRYRIIILVITLIREQDINHANISSANICRCRHRVKKPATYFSLHILTFLSVKLILSIFHISKGLEQVKKKSVYFIIKRNQLLAKAMRMEN